jgi:hypothetical protein
MPLDRRSLLTTLAGAALMTDTAIAAAASGAVLPAIGKPGDFSFLSGEWRIHNRFREGEKWIEFPGEASVFEILAGICSVEELRIPSRKFSGTGIRLLDVEKRIWNDHWVNAKSGVISVPGQQGVFVDGVGTFTSEAEVDGVREIYRGVWDRITPTSCRWYQGFSRDAGKSWTDTWFMDWTRAG